MIDAANLYGMVDLRNYIGKRRRRQLRRRLLFKLVDRSSARNRILNLPRLLQLWPHRSRHRLGRIRGSVATGTRNRN